MRRTFSLRGERLGQPEAWAHFPRMRRAFSLRGERPGQPEVCAPCLFPPRPQRALRLGLRKSLDRNRGLFAGWEGVASLGLSLPLSPPPASFLQRGWGSSSLEFLSPLVLRTAGGVFRPVNFSLLSQSLKKASLRLLSGPSGRSLPYAMPPAPLRSAPTCWWQVRASGVLFCWELLLGR